MISIMVFYSPDRKPQFHQMEECMRDMDLYDQCQKTLLVDGEPNVAIDGWVNVEVPRRNGTFCWADMWEAGVDVARNDVILYLDSDRVLPRDYLKLVLDKIDDDRFLFCQDLFSFTRPVDTQTIKHYRDETNSAILKRDYDRHKDLLWYDPRYRLPPDGPGKGVMSGNTAFTKKTYIRSGGVDPWYCSHGAYADTDYQKQCWEMGMKMVDLAVLELHIHHEKVSAESEGDLLSRRDLEVLSLNNYIRYCRKWHLSLDRARYIARCLKLGDDFVKRVRQALDLHESATNDDFPWQPLLH